MQSIAAVTVLFHPSPEDLGRISTYLDYVDRLFLIDNTGRRAVLPSFLEESPKIVYIPNEANAGVARALNQAADLAAEQGFEWLLTMDQDSSFDPVMAEMFFEGAARLAREEDAGIISPEHVEQPFPGPGDPFSHTERMTVMTSGNLVRLKALREAGGYEDALFIDTVDHDLCLRMKLAGYRILRFNAIWIRHALGEEFEARRRKETFKIRVHRPERMYWITRNNLRMWKVYGAHFPEYIREYRRIFFHKTLKNILCYEREKLPKLFHALRGCLDFRRGRFGRAGEMPEPEPKEVKRRVFPAGTRTDGTGRSSEPDCPLTILTLFTGDRLYLARYLPALMALQKPADTQLLFIVNSRDMEFYRKLRTISPDTWCFPEVLADDVRKSTGDEGRIVQARQCARLYTFAKPRIRGRDLLIIEHDVIPRPDALERLEAGRRRYRADLISASVISRMCGEPLGWRLKPDMKDVRRIPAARSPKRVFATGFCFLLMRSADFIRMPMLPERDPVKGFFGCDLNAGTWARKNNLRWFMDGGVRCGHLTKQGQFVSEGDLADVHAGILKRLQTEEWKP